MRLKSELTVGGRNEGPEEPRNFFFVHMTRVLVFSPIVLVNVVNTLSCKPYQLTVISGQLMTSKLLMNSELLLRLNPHVGQEE